MSVFKKLSEARIKLQSIELKKSGLNKFSNYTYFVLPDFLPNINTIFNDIGLCGVVSFTADLATLTITDTDDGSELKLTSPMGSAQLKGMHEVQNIGAVESYQRRYLWMTAMEISEHDAIDEGAGAGDGDIATTGLISKAQFEALTSLLLKVGMSNEMFCDKSRIPSVRELPANQFIRAVNYLNAQSTKGEHHE